MVLLITDITTAISSAQFLSGVILAILFLQSGLDKVIDWSGNLSWLKGHFAKSPLKNMVPMLLGIITVVEIAAGVVSAIGAGALLLNGSVIWLLRGAQLSAISIVMLFFGQRLAKEYTGARGLISYFILTILVIWLTTL